MYKNNQAATTLTMDPKLLIKFHPPKHQDNPGYIEGKKVKI
jgi:hypothetical protein